MPKEMALLLLGAGVGVLGFVSYRAMLQPVSVPTSNLHFYDGPINVKQVLGSNSPSQQPTVGRNQNNMTDPTFTPPGYDQRQLVRNVQDLSSTLTTKNQQAMLKHMDNMHDPVHLNFPDTYSAVLTNDHEAHSPVWISRRNVLSQNAAWRLMNNGYVDVSQGPQMGGASDNRPPA